MADYKTNDHVRVPSGKKGYVTSGGRLCPVWTRRHGDGGDYLGTYNSHELELITTEGGDMNKPYQRKTYRLVKDLPVARKGTLVQEECDDGTQPYKVLNPADLTYGSSLKFADRKSVEDQPNWFVEVFVVEPAFMTREELDQWEAFRAQRATKKPARKVASGKAAVKKTA